MLQDYFRLADQRRPEILELFHDDAEVYFPTFGFGRGRQSLLEMMKGFEDRACSDRREIATRPWPSCGGRSNWA
jgi:hypothetical protein